MTVSELDVRRLSSDDRAMENRSCPIMGPISIYHLNFHGGISALAIEGDGIKANILAFGPKMRLAKNWLALYVPIGFAFGGDVESSSDTWQIHPTLLMTLPIAKYFELNPSAKIMIPLSNAEELRTLYAFNLGLALSTDVSKWAIRPEVGLCTTFEGDYFLQYSIGLTLGSGLFK